MEGNIGLSKSPRVSTFGNNSPQIADTSDSTGHCNQPETAGNSQNQPEPARTSWKQPEPAGNNCKETADWLIISQIVSLFGLSQWRRLPTVPGTHRRSLPLPKIG